MPCRSYRRATEKCYLFAARISNATTTDEDGDREYLDVARLTDKVYWTPPQSFADCAVKLRLVADPAIGMEAGDRADGGDVAAVRQVLDYIERAVAGGAV